MTLHGACVILCVVISQFLVHAYPSNVSDSICLSLVPNSVSAKAQIQPSPYYVKLQQATYSPFEVISVSLSSDKPFIGFILQARSLSSHDNSSVGEFLDPLPEGSQFLQCNSLNGTVTNKEEGNFSYLQFDWRAPNKDLGNIRMRATFVYNITTYWTGVEADHDLVYQIPDKPLPTTLAPTTHIWCHIIKCSCHGGTAEIFRDKNGCIKSCHCKYSCPRSSFQCKNGLCISGNYKCDGDSDCEDNSDEEGCPAIKTNDRSNYWYTPGRNAAVGVAIILMLVIITYYMYRRYMILYNQQDAVSRMSGQSWFRRPSQRERHQTQLEMINAIIEERLERQQLEEGHITELPSSDLPPYSPTDEHNIKPPPSYDQVCGLPPPEYSEVTEECNNSATTLDGSLNSQSASSMSAAVDSSSIRQGGNRVDT